MTVEYLKQLKSGILCHIVKNKSSVTGVICEILGVSRALQRKNLYHGWEVRDCGLP